MIDLSSGRREEGEAAGGGERGAKQKRKLKQKPCAKLRHLITAYFYVPLSKVENVGALRCRLSPSPPPRWHQPTTPELLLAAGGMPEYGQVLEVVEEEEEEGEGTIEPATLVYYGPLHCRRQRRDRKECGLAPCSGERRMPGLGRDVLRWLVTLNLSFPIKNIKRDFSNGFMVAEIFSRYFPNDIYMHSFDYGSRAASKRDNWEQLNKIFRKKGFIVLNHEIDNIIQCRTEEGAGPLLERMYGFLTRVRYKPGECDAEQLFVQEHDDSSKIWNPQAPVDATSYEYGRDVPEQLSCVESPTTSGNNGDHSDEAYEVRRRDATLADDMYHGAMRLDPLYENSSLLKMDDQEYDFDFRKPQDGGGRFVLDEREREILQNSRTKGSNAVERARQRELQKQDRIAKAGPRGEEERIAELVRKSRVDAGLAFRSPNRKRNFKQYTLPDYRRVKQFGYVELGRLGPGDPTPELVNQRDKLAQRKQFGRRARSCNIMSHANPTLVDYSKAVKVESASSRQKALAFASRIPKPKVKVSAKESEENVLPLQNPHAMTDLQMLEAKHQSDKKHVESIRRDLEHFLR